MYAYSGPSEQQLPRSDHGGLSLATHAVALLSKISPQWKEIILKFRARSALQLPQLQPVDIAQLLGRLRQGALILLAGRPGVGVSLLAMHLALEHGLIQSQPVHVFSNQWWFGNWIERLAFTAARVDVSRVRGGLLDALEKSRLATTELALNQAPLTFHQGGKTLLRSLPTRVLEVLQHKDCQQGALVLIDFQQCHGPRLEAHSQRLVSTLVDLKQIAAKFDATVVVLSSLRRRLEIRADKRPRLIDLPECLVEDAVPDQTCLLYRRGLYEQNEIAPSFKVEIWSHDPLSEKSLGLEIQLGEPTND
ncbi:MAG: DnaB-like helicase C-terminal domain-containing protein [Hydrogenophaga sp.]|uniref:DnaB-like helicase C-terminal domain-containing protein n=1 Tax=Hydrogenophaga sp. TaxID=1904254 RepID=UPI0040358DB9